MRFRTVDVAVALGLSCALAGVATAQPGEADRPLTGRDIALRMDAVDTSKDSSSQATMTITRKGKTLVRKLITYSKVYGGDERSLIRFQHPSDIKDVTYLIWSYQGLEKLDDIWVYLPAANLVRRISGASKHASFMRSDLANEDIQEKDDVEEYDYKILGSEIIDGVDCYILERIPKEGKDTQYSKQVEWIRKDNWLRQRSEYYDKKGKYLKTATYNRHQLIDGIWTITMVTVETPKKQSKTVVEWQRLQYNVGLEDNLFEHSQLQR